LPFASTVGAFHEIMAYGTLELDEDDVEDEFELDAVLDALEDEELDEFCARE